MNTSKILTLAVTFALLVTTLLPILGVGPVARAAAEDPVEVKIGLLNDATGPIAVYSSGFTSAALLAIDHLNDGQTNYHFTLIEQDSACDGTTAATAAQTLVDSNVSGIAGAACSGATLGAQPIATTAEIPIVSYASTSPALTTADDNGYMFRVVPSDAWQGAAMASMAAAHGWQNPALMYMTNDYGAGLAGTVKGAYAAGGVSMCTEIAYDDDTTDFSTQVTQLANAECDSLIMVTYATDGAAILEEMATQGIQGPTSPVCSADCPFPIMGGDGIADMGFLAAFSDPSAAGGVIATKPSPSFTSTERDAFDTAWAAGNHSAAIYTHETYDAVTIIGKAAMADTDGDLRDDLAALGVGYAGASGVHTFDAAGDVLPTQAGGYAVCQFVPVIVDGAPSLNLACTGAWNIVDGLSFPYAAHIKIGMLNPITGPLAVYSPGFTIASQVAISYMNTIAPLTFQFSLIEADSGCDGTTAATAAQTLIDAGVVGIAGAACSGATLGAIEVAKVAGVPMVSYASTSPAITNHDDDGYLFRVVPSDAQQGAALADAYTASGYSSPALISMTNDYGAGFAAAFKENYDGELCAEAAYDDDTTDFTATVESVASGGCDSVVMITYATDGAYIAEEMATQGLAIPIFGGDGIADINFATAFTDASLVSGITVTKPASGPSSSLGAMFDMFYGAAATAAGFDGGIYTREVFDAVAIIGLAEATALRTPADDGAKDMLGVLVAAQGAPQDGASGSHEFDANGDVAGSGFDVCTFGADAAGATTLDCHSSWGLFDGLTDGGIAKKPAEVDVVGCMDSTANNYDADATKQDDDVVCTFDEVTDEVPGFGLLSAVAAIGVVLLLRRRN